jgi:hypothetical protein
MKNPARNISLLIPVPLLNPKNSPILLYNSSIKGR